MNLMPLLKRAPIIHLKPVGTPAQKASVISDELDQFIQSYPGRRRKVTIEIESSDWSDRAQFIIEMTAILCQCERPFKLNAARSGDIRLKVSF